MRASESFKSLCVKFPRTPISDEHVRTDIPLINSFHHRMSYNISSYLLHINFSVQKWVI